MLCTKDLVLKSSSEARNALEETLLLRGKLVSFHSSHWSSLFRSSFSLETRADLGEGKVMRTLIPEGECPSIVNTSFLLEGNFASKMHRSVKFAWPKLHGNQRRLRVSEQLLRNDSDRTTLKSPKIDWKQGRKKYTPPPWRPSVFSFSGSEALWCIPFFPDLWCIPFSLVFPGKWYTP